MEYPRIPEELFYDVITALQSQDTIARQVDAGLGVINSSYTVCDLDKYTRKTLARVFSTAYGEHVYDWIEWWLYDTEGRGGACYKGIVEYTIDTPKKLYNFIYS